MFDLLPPIITHYDKRRQHVCKSVRYNPTGQRLDIWRPQKLLGPVPAPVLLFVPGGGWMIGHRRGQSHELMSHLVDQGWICVAIDYRTAPRNRWPVPLLDVKTALNWAQDHIAEWGGDPDFIAIAGASAGGHMASLAGLAWDHPSLITAPPWFDFRPSAVVSLYGVYDWQFRGSPYHAGFGQILEKVIVGKSQREHPEIYRDASPIQHVRPNAPPFLVVHGTGDWLTPVGGARRFTKKLSSVSKEAVVYYEIPGATHAFDLINPDQSSEAIGVISGFLHGVRQRHDLRAA